MNQQHLALAFKPEVFCLASDLHPKAKSPSVACVQRGILHKEHTFSKVGGHRAFPQTNLSGLKQMLKWVFLNQTTDCSPRNSQGKPRTPRREHTAEAQLSSPQLRQNQRLTAWCYRATSLGKVKPASHPKSPISDQAVLKAVKEYPHTTQKWLLYQPEWFYLPAI